jgi:hypothetical protein
MSFSATGSKVHSDVSERPSMKPITSSTSGSHRLICLAKIAILSASGKDTLTSGCLNNFCTTNNNIAQIVRLPWKKTSKVAKMLASTILSYSKMKKHHHNGISLSMETLLVLIMHNSVGKCGSKQNYLREAVQQKGRDISAFDEFSPALIDCFILCHIFFQTM